MCICPEKRGTSRLSVPTDTKPIPNYHGKRVSHLHVSIRK